MGERSLVTDLSLVEGPAERRWTGRQQPCSKIRLFLSSLEFGDERPADYTPQARWEAAETVQGSFYSSTVNKGRKQVVESFPQVITSPGFMETLSHRGLGGTPFWFPLMGRVLPSMLRLNYLLGNLVE